MVERITALSPEAAHWPAQSYLGLPGWVAESDAGVVGLVVTGVAADEMEILNLAVEPDWRRRGVGTALVETALEHGRRSGAKRVFLEVRESNQAARGFYRRQGFAVAGRRPRYYRRPDEDAVVMARQVGSGR